MEAYWQDADAQARRQKEPFIVQKQLVRLYSRFDAHDRLMAAQVLSEWILSRNENVRFDALALIRELKIVAAIPSLRKLAERLGKDKSPGAPFELEKVKSIVAEIEPICGTD